LFDETIAIHSRIDVLVNNVGLFEFSGDLVDSSKEYWDEIFDINVNSAFLCANRAAREMRKARWGRIINISSAAGKVGAPGECGYSAAKWAILGFTKTLALELAPDIRVNAVCPGYIDTSMSDVWLEKIAERKGITVEEAKRERLAAIPLRRVGTPEEVASAVVFLASDEASYTIGEGLNVSGGRVMG
jgi:3-oxoacyl-[acyl-carrier protein] reductase